jgi:hypothetical protein
MESVQALLAAEAADTIVGFLVRVRQQDRTPHRHCARCMKTTPPSTIRWMKATG